MEVALLREMARSITPLLDESAATADLRRATTAIFYSISNTQSGLRGVSFGDSLIKRVVEALQREFAQLKTFATLSPIPGLRAWLQKAGAAEYERLPERLRADLPPEAGDMEGLLRVANSTSTTSTASTASATDAAVGTDERGAVARALLRLGARYLATAKSPDGRVLDSVARFHLGNGARIEAINWAADPSPKGQRQSCGLMVNYHYDLKRLDRHRTELAQGQVPVSSAVQSLLS